MRKFLIRINFLVFSVKLSTTKTPRFWLKTIISTSNETFWGEFKTKLMDFWWRSEQITKCKAFAYDDKKQKGNSICYPKKITAYVFAIYSRSEVIYHVIFLLLKTPSW